MSNSNIVKNKLVRFKEWTCVIQVQEYADKTPALSLVDAETGEPIATATVNVGLKLQGDLVCIKNYSENEGVLEALQKAGIVSEVLYQIPSGYVEIPVVKLLIKK